MPQSHESIVADLNEYHTVLKNITSSDDLRQYAAGAGYTDDELKEIQELWETARDLTNQQHLETLEAHEATTTLKRFFSEFHDSVLELVKAGRLLYPNDGAMQNTLGLVGDREKSYDGFADQAEAFLRAALERKRVLQRFARRKYPASLFRQGLKDIQHLRDLLAERTKESGEAQQYTQQRNAVLKKLDREIAELVGFVRLKANDDPQALEKLGRVVRS